MNEERKQMVVSLEKIVIKICESLPRDVTILKKEQYCSFENDVCEYVKKYEMCYLCCKDTKTMDMCKYEK